MIQTKRGLPNTCSGCGKGPLLSWWAETEDHARAGIGYCAQCAAPPISAQSSALAEIDDLQWTGMTASWIAILREHGFDSLDAIEAATLEELMAIRGIGPATARTIKANAAEERVHRDRDI